MGAQMYLLVGRERQREHQNSIDLISRNFFLNFSFRKDYIAFEQGINPMIAEKMTGDKSRDYMNARRVSKEYEAITRGLDRSFLSLPPCGSIDEIKQVWFFISHKNNCIKVNPNSKIHTYYACVTVG